jgi:hypothetical protein
MARYEVSFIIETDIEEAGQQPWWLLLGEDVMPVEWLEYVMVRELDTDEMVLRDPTPDNTINVFDMTFKPEPPKPDLKLVVNNDDNQVDNPEVDEEQSS